MLNVKTLRTAAAQMRATASDAYPGPWVSDSNEDCWRLHSKPDRNWPTAQILKAPKHDTPYAEYWPDEPAAAHITAWHPGVALVVADWLDATAAKSEELNDLLGVISEPANDPIWNAAVRVARIYLGEPDV
jgi:hypothetical protein